MGNWINKHFNKGRCIQAIIHHTDRRITQHFVIPKTGLVQIKEQAYKVDNDSFYMLKGFRTYVYAENNIDPMNLYKTPSATSPDELNTAISARVATEIFLANKANIDKLTIAIMCSIGAIIGVVVLGVMVMKRFDAIDSDMTLIEQLLRAMGGYVG